MSYTRCFVALTALAGSIWMVGCGNPIFEAIARELEISGPSTATVVQGSSTMLTLTAEAGSDMKIGTLNYTDDANSAIMAVTPGETRELAPNRRETDLTIQSAFDAPPRTYDLKFTGEACVDQVGSCPLGVDESVDFHTVAVTIVAALSGQIDAPADGVVLTGSPVQVDVTIVDALGAVADVVVWLNGAVVVDAFDGTPTSPITVSESVPLTTPGTNVIKVTATNATGSTWSDSVTIDYQPGVSGTVSTVAGSGVDGFMDGPDTTAQFSSPTGVTLDGSGNPLVADFSNNRIRMVSPSGDVTTVAGSGTYGFADGAAGTAQFRNPAGIVVDGAGDIYVADLLNHRIRMISSGLVSTIAGTGAQGFVDGPGASATFQQPIAIAIDPTSGDLLVADLGNHSIRRITLVASVWTVSTVAGTGSAGMNDGAGNVAQFDLPQGVAVDTSGLIYVGDFNNNRIRVIDGSGNVSTLTGMAAFGDADGPPSVATLNGPRGLVLDGNGDVIFADQNNNKIRMVDAASGTVTTVAGLALGGGFMDGSISIAQFFAPVDVAVNTEGHIFVADLINNRIRKIEP
jgi:NHL repeat